MATLDQFFRELGWPRIELVKLDIEGEEPRALLGMRELVHRNPRLSIILEVNASALARAGLGTRELGEMLKTLGFETGSIVETGGSVSLVDGLVTDRRATFNLQVRRTP